MTIYTIYKATNTINGKCYVGFDSKWPNRQKHHQRDYNLIDRVFYSAIRKYGWESFSWDIVYQSKDKKHTLNEMEPFFIKELCSYGERGYNSTIGGDGALGCKRSKETREKIGKSKLGIPRSQELKDHLSKIKSGVPTGMKHTEEHKKKISEKYKNRVFSDEWKRKISEAKKGQIPWNKGKVKGDN